ncbi:SDR family oxidoreductase [Marinactinospora thermotolerans]|uniref:NAD(P)-dependent dehydrogenase, short-chain alcohol dehydrogenase family n=1 Tax=Marinactinospora thermotolerans DSM 45154 TaxID=1122192 RepID=A0A1T4RRR5_9ACTN|nr:SDR family oxidoreductase [Marinactinospora thermotolerans]SKA18654.1 NAD(P)-dependent dehydrogenase, short-chain alcohol dehydrogenase family [Marinactinospora thermotolerans DSM 45154]
MSENTPLQAAESASGTFGDYDRVAIVTGGDSGIGRATVVALAERGFDVGLTYHEDEEGARGAAEEVRAAGRTAAVRRHDLRDPQTAAGVVEELIAELGGVGVLVNNAGVGTQQPLLDIDYAQWRDTLAVDLDGPFLCARAAGRHMVAQGRGGRIVNVTSVHEAYPRVGAGPYCAAKGGLRMLTRTLALELSAHGITANAVAPGEIATPMTGQHEQPPVSGSRGGYPLGRPGDAREVASVIAFLAGPESSYVTGATVFVDGGMTMMGPQASGALETGEWRAG